MKYLFLLILLLPHIGWAQPELTGLGNYIIGKTTPDSLRLRGFKEAEIPLVKGTLTLPCTHIRTFTSGRVTVAGVLVANLVLFFYDDQLFEIACDYDQELEKRFVNQYGKGTLQPTSNFQFCANSQPLLVWSEVWPGSDVLARVVHLKGYTSTCALKKAARLIISNQKIAALSSECDLKHTGPFPEEADKALRDYLEKEWNEK